MIFVIWAFNIQSMFSQVGLLKSEEGQIIDSANQDLKEIFSATEPQKEIIKENITNIITAAQAETQKQETIDTIKETMAGMFASSTSSTPTTIVNVMSTTTTEIIKKD
jgi:hypothetical protein